VWCIVFDVCRVMCVLCFARCVLRDVCKAMCDVC